MSAKTNILGQAHRSRRSLVKAAAVVFGALAVSSAGSTGASAQGDHRECFLRGTRIRSSRGYRRIETLKAGDLVATRFAGAMPILRIDSYVVPRGTVRPVRVSRSALDDNVPVADLWLTAPHALYVDGVLISVVNLVNGTTIAFDDDVGGDELEFFHIELATHDVIDAEGAACESLLTPSMTRCAPRLALNGGRSELKSRLRSAAAVVVDRRTPFDIVRDRIEERSLFLG